MPRPLLAALALVALAGCHVPPEADNSIIFEFHSDPAGAEVWVDGVFVGQTPLMEKYEWPPECRRKKVVFRLEGYIPETRALTEEATIIEVHMQEVIEMLTLRVESDPPGAALEYDGGMLGTTPIEVRLNLQSRTSDLRVILPGYRSEIVTGRDLRKGDPVRVRLTPLIPRLH